MHLDVYNCVDFTFQKLDFVGFIDFKILMF